METLFIALVTLTYALDLLTRVLLSPTPSLIFAPGPSVSWASHVTSEDEFSTALIKVGISCLEATNFVGLANELAPIDGSGEKKLRAGGAGRDGYYSQGEVQLGKSGVQAIIPGDTRGALRLRRKHGLRDTRPPEPLTGFFREIKRVGPSHDAVERARDTSVGGDIFGYWGEGIRRPEVRRLGSLGWRYAFGFLLWAWRGWKAWWRRALRGEHAPSLRHQRK